MGAATTRGRVSVIIPTFNYGHFITDCIRSVIAQGIEDCEIIVVDDGSTDDTASILEPFSDRIHYVNQENQGLSSARNTGLKHATGEFIQFLDSDDLLGKNALRGRLDFLRANPGCSIAVCRNSKFTRLGRRGQPVTKGSWELYQSNLALHLCRFNIAPPLAFLLRRRVVDEVGDFDVSLSACEDYDYWLRAVVHGFIPQFCAEGEVFYRVHESSMSANRTNQVRHDAEMHLRLYKYIFVDGDFPAANRASSRLAFLTGLAKTLSVLWKRRDQETLCRLLTERFLTGVRWLDDSLKGSDLADDLYTRLYAQWFTYQLIADANLLKLAGQVGRMKEFVAQNTKMPRILDDFLISFRSTAGNKLEAKRLAEISMAVKFPRLAAALMRK